MRCASSWCFLPSVWAAKGTNVLIGLTTDYIRHLHFLFTYFSAKTEENYFTTWNSNYSFICSVLCQKWHFPRDTPLTGNFLKNLNSFNYGYTFILMSFLRIQWYTHWRKLSFFLASALSRRILKHVHINKDGPIAI